MAKKPEGLEQLLVEDLQDLFDAEKQLVRALPKMAKAASDEELGNALREHLEVTKGQVTRLEQIFESMEMRAKSRPCKGMKGIVEEGQEQLQEDHEAGIMDSALTASARKVEHYEMVGYESARSLAQQLGMREAAQLLDETLREEMQADKQLSQISKRLLKESGRTMSGGAESEGRRSARGGNARSSNSKAAGASQRGNSSKASARGGSKTASAKSASGKSAGKSSGGRDGRNGAKAEPLTDHEQIRQWAEERSARPSCVRGTGSGNDTGMIRLDFPGYTGEDSLEEISWDDWFEKFDENGLALLVQQTTAGGEKSNFNKLVSRQTAQSKGRPKARAAR